MKRIATIVTLATISLSLQVAAAQGTGQGMKDMPMNASSTAGSHKGTGTVMKADIARGIVTLAHDPVASMKWPAKIMEFEVADKKMFESIKLGMRVQFEFKEMSKGKYVITEMKR